MIPKNKKKAFLKNDNAIAGGLIAVAAILILGSFVLISITPLANEFTKVDNTLATQGMVTDRMHSYMGWNNKITQFLPILLVFGLLAWGMIYAQEHR